MPDAPIKSPFAPIPAGRFQRFHETFLVDTWDSCALCGGQCEINKIGSLMPGEPEFIAKHLGMDAGKFRDAYLDAIITPYGTVDVLKLKPGCPFLSCDFRCTITDVKVVLCEAYPIVFEVTGDEVDFMLDEWCPIVRLRPQIAALFAERGFPAIRELDAPLDWYRAVATYDSLCVDYARLFQSRETSPGYTAIPLSQVTDCEAEAASLPDFGQFRRQAGDLTTGQTNEHSCIHPAPPRSDIAF